MPVDEGSAGNTRPALATAAAQLWPKGPIPVLGPVATGTRAGPTVRNPGLKPAASSLPYSTRPAPLLEWRGRVTLGLGVEAQPGDRGTGAPGNPEPVWLREVRARAPPPWRLPSPRPIAWRSRPSRAGSKVGLQLYFTPPLHQTQRLFTSPNTGALELSPRSRGLLLSLWPFQLFHRQNSTPASGPG